MTYPAPSRAAARSSVADTVAPAPVWLTMRSASCSAKRRRSAPMSWRDSSRSSRSSVKLQRSVTTLRVNSMLPAPTKATFSMGAVSQPGGTHARSSRAIARFCADPPDTAGRSARRDGHARLLQFLQDRGVRVLVGDQDVDLGEVTDVGEGRVSELGAVRDDHHALGTPEERPVGVRLHL